MDYSPTLPRFIALCGNPTSGKTTAAEILEELFGYKLVDDGQFLRKIGIDHFGLTHQQVYSQAGKLESVVINGETMTVRDVLGRIGNGFEEQFGADVIPELAYNNLRDANGFAPHQINGFGGRFVFGSVRREQGWYHRKRGALVIEIENPLAEPSPYEFDRYNAKACHISVLNDGLARGLSPAEARKDLASKLTPVLEAAASMIRDMIV